MKEVACFQTADGKLFTVKDRDSAKAHEAMLKFAAWYEDNKCVGSFDSYGVEAEDMISWLQENKEEVLKFFGKS